MKTQSINTIHFLEAGKDTKLIKDNTVDQVEDLFVLSQKELILKIELLKKNF